MPDIFDQIAAQPQGDIFDQVAAQQPVQDYSSYAPQTMSAADEAAAIQGLQSDHPIISNAVQGIGSVLGGMIPRTPQQAAMQLFPFVPPIAALQAKDEAQNIAQGDYRGIPFIGRIQDIQQAEQTPPFSKERFAAGARTLMDVGLLAGLGKGEAAPEAAPPAAADVVAPEVRPAAPAPEPVPAPETVAPETAQVQPPAEVPAAPSFTDSRGIEYRKENGFWIGKNDTPFMGGSDIRITDPQVAARLDQEYAAQAAAPEPPPSEPVPQPEQAAPAPEAAPPEAPQVSAIPQEQTQAPISNEQLGKIYEPGQITPGKGRGPAEFQQMGLNDTRDPYAVLSKAQRSGVALPDDVPLLRVEHERLVNAARDAYGTPQYDELAQRAANMANAIKGVAHGPASDIMRSLQDWNGPPRYDSPADFDQIVRERLNRESTPQETATFTKAADEIKTSDQAARQEAASARDQLRQYRRGEQVPFEDAAKYIQDQITKLTKDCGL